MGLKVTSPGWDKPRVRQAQSAPRRPPAAPSPSRTGRWRSPRTVSGGSDSCLSPATSEVWRDLGRGDQPVRGETPDTAGPHARTPRSPHRWTWRGSWLRRRRRRARSERLRGAALRPPGVPRAKVSGRTRRPWRLTWRTSSECCGSTRSPCGTSSPGASTGERCGQPSAAGSRAGGSPGPRQRAAGLAWPSRWDWALALTGALSFCPRPP